MIIGSHKNCTLIRRSMYDGAQFKLYKCCDCDRYIYHRVDDNEYFVWEGIKFMNTAKPLGIVCDGNSFDLDALSCSEMTIKEII